MMSNNPSFHDGLQFAFDATSIELAQTCARKYYYQMILNVRPNDTSVHLLFGGLYAAAIEHYHLHLMSGASHDEALERVVGEALVNSWGHDTDEKGRIAGTGQPLAFDHAAKTRSTLIRTIVWYLEEVNEGEPFETYFLQSGKPAVELSFSLPFTDDFIYCGHLDRVVRYGDGLYWLDNKTSGQPLTPFYFASFAHSNQFFGYTWAGQAILSSPIKGGIIDSAYIAAGYSDFVRQPLTFTADRIEEWYENTLETIHTIRSYTARRTFPMNLTACGNYGGCPYKELCERSPRVREHYLRSNFKQVAPWSPITPR